MWASGAGKHPQGCRNSCRAESFKPGSAQRRLVSSPCWGFERWTSHHLLAGGSTGTIGCCWVRHPGCTGDWGPGREARRNPATRPRHSWTLAVKRGYPLGEKRWIAANNFVQDILSDVISMQRKKEVLSFKLCIFGQWNSLLHDASAAVSSRARRKRPWVGMSRGGYSYGCDSSLQVRRRKLGGCTASLLPQIRIGCKISKNKIQFWWGLFVHGCGI